MKEKANLKSSQQDRSWVASAMKELGFKDLISVKRDAEKEKPADKLFKAAKLLTDAAKNNMAQDNIIFAAACLKKAGQIFEKLGDKEAAKTKFCEAADAYIFYCEKMRSYTLSIEAPTATQAKFMYAFQQGRNAIEIYLLLKETEKVKKAKEVLAELYSHFADFQETKGDALSIEYAKLWRGDSASNYLFLGMTKKAKEQEKLRSRLKITRLLKLVLKDFINYWKNPSL